MFGLNGLREGSCWDCVNFESLIQDKLDFHDDTVKREVVGSEGINILYQILKTYGVALKGGVTHEVADDAGVRLGSTEFLGGA